MSNLTTFRPTFLYIKQHKVTGLKYFGKTHQNPERYKGSGMYWKDHCKKHGYDIETVWYQLFLDADTIKEVALNFSHQNDIVNSSEWANLVEENGINSGRGRWTQEQRKAARGVLKTEEHKKKISEKLTGENNPMFGKTVSQDTRIKMKESHAKNKTLIECPHCGKVGSNRGAMMLRHFDRCPHHYRIAAVANIK